MAQRYKLGISQEGQIYTVDIASGDRASYGLATTHVSPYGPAGGTLPPPEILAESYAAPEVWQQLYGGFNLPVPSLTAEQTGSPVPGAPGYPITPISQEQLTKAGFTPEIVAREQARRAGLGTTNIPPGPGVAAALAQQPPTPQPQTYTVESGDTLSKIAGRFGVGVQDITGYRSGNPNLIFPGEVLTIGSKVQPGTQPPLTTTGGVPLEPVPGQAGVFQRAGAGAPPAPGPTGGTGLTKTQDTDSLLAQFGLGNNAAQLSLDDVIKQVSSAFGLDSVNKALTDLDDKHIEEVANINLNPWISEGLRSKKVTLAQEKYEKKKDAMVDRLKLQQDVVGKAISIWEKERDFRKDMLKIALDQKEKEVGRDTSDIREYRLAQSQGFQGTFLQYQAQVKKPSGGGVSFSDTQIARGAAVANIPLADFQRLDQDSQNFFINNDKQITDFKKIIDESKIKKADPSVLEKTISEMAIPEPAKDTLTRYLKTVFSGSTQTTLPWWQRIF